MIRQLHDLLVAIGFAILIPAAALALGGDDAPVVYGDDDAFAHVVTAGGHHIVARNVDGAIALWRSSDGGLTWSEWTRFDDGNALTTFTGQDALAVSVGNDRIWVLYRHVTTGTLGGISFDALLAAWVPTDAANPTWTSVGIDAALAETFSQASFTTDEVSFSAYNLYVAYTKDEADGQDIWFARSVDQGASFETPYRLAESPVTGTDYLDPDVAYGYGGWVHVAWAERPPSGFDPLHVNYRGAYNRAQPGFWDTQVTRLATGTGGDRFRKPRMATRVGVNSLLITLEYHRADGVMSNPRLRVLSSDNNGRAWSNVLPHDYYNVGFPFYDAGGWGIVAGSTSSRSGVLRPGGGGLADPWTFTAMFEGYGAPVCFPAVNQVHGNRFGAVAYVNHQGVHRLSFDAAWFGDPGYPITLDDLPDADGDICLIDLDDDGAEEIVVTDGATDELRVYAHVAGTEGDFAPLRGFPVGVPIGTSGLWGHTAAGDLDDTGGPEILVASYDGLYAYSRAGLPRPGWPFRQKAQIQPRWVSLGRISGSAPLDVVAVGPDRVWLLRADGSVRPGFPAMFPTEHGQAVGPASLGDVDYDGEDEILVTLEHAILLYGRDGALERVVYGAPSLGLTDRAILAQLDSDYANGLEIAFSNGSRVHLITRFGYSALPGWPWDEPDGLDVGPLAAAHVWGGFEPELVFGTAGTRSLDNRVHILDRDLDPVFASPFSIGTDLAAAEIVVGRRFDSLGSVLHQVAADGTLRTFTSALGLLDGWPRETGAPVAVGACGDVTGDGMLEFVAGGVVQVFGGGTEAAPTGQTGWLMAGANPRRSGHAYEPIHHPTPVHDDPSGTRLFFAGASPNPAPGPADFHFSLPQGGVVDVAVYDVRGRKVRTVLRSELGPGEHRARWDGRDAAGRSVASGLYFARVGLQAGGREQVEVRKLSVMR